MYKDLSTVEKHVTDLSALNQSIKNILLTRRGSLPGKPRFGSDLYKVVFSQMDSLTESMAKNYVIEALSEFETRIEVNNITITKAPEYNKIIVNINFSYRDKNFDSTTGEITISY